MIYEEAEYNAAYSNYAIDPTTNIRYVKANIPEFPEDRITFRLGYHPHMYRSVADKKADMLLEGHVSISETDGVVIIGGAYGWLGESLEALTGCSCVSVDPSQYIQNTKDLTGDDLLLDELDAQGYLHSDIGDFLYNSFKCSTFMSMIPVVKTLDNIEKELGCEATVFITEEVWQILSNKDQEKYSKAAKGKTLRHIINGRVF